MADQTGNPAGLGGSSLGSAGGSGATSASGSQDVSRWQCIYPVYINSARTIAAGRRVPKSKACENPTLQEIVDSCTFLKIPVHAEPYKAYSRDLFERGRVRVQLKHSDGTLHNPDIPSKMALMVKLGALVPKHSGRSRKDGGGGGGGGGAQSSAGGEKVQEKKGKGGKKKR